MSPKTQQKLQGVTQCIVGAAPRGRPKERGEIFEMQHDTSSEVSGQPHGVEKGQPHGVAPTLGDVVGWYKTMTTNEYIRHVKQDNWKAFTGRLWQRNYFEHIIRNDYDLGRVREYVGTNPKNWATDRVNPDYKADDRCARRGRRNTAVVAKYLDRTKE